MQERSIASDAGQTGMIDSVAQKSAFSPGAQATPPSEDPPCDCGGPPPPRFLIPPPPADPSWAAGDTDVCDIVAPYQVCHALTGGAPGSGDQSSSPLSVLAVILAASGLLLIVLLVGLLFFCKYRRRVRGLLSGKASSGKRSHTSSMLYDGLPAQTQVIPNSLRTNGQVPHIEMVAVKGQCRQLIPGGRPGVAGTLFVYPPPPSLTDEGCERASNMYEEIPYYGRQPPSVSYYSDSDDDVISRPSDDVIIASDEELRRHHACLSSGAVEEGSGRRVHRTTPAHTLSGVPSSVGRIAGQQHHRGESSGDRRRRSPVSPGGFLPGYSRTKPVHRDESLLRKDPYYYSDILARRQQQTDVTGGRHRDVISPGSDVTEAYKRPFDDERRSQSRGSAYCQPDLRPSQSRSPSVLSRDRSDLGLPKGHVSPLANRMTLDPFVDAYGSERDSNRRPAENLGSFRSPTSTGGTPPRDQHGTSDSGYMDVPPGFDQGGTSELNRYHRPPQWTH